MVTLHHFTDPIGFDWQKPDVESFVTYAQEAVAVLHAAGVRKFLTINEPSVIAFQGWVMGEFPPNKKNDVEGAAHALENMMRVHTRIYESLKQTYGNTIEIGLSHNPIRFRYYHKSTRFGPRLKRRYATTSLRSTTRPSSASCKRAAFP